MIFSYKKKFFLVSATISAAIALSSCTTPPDAKISKIKRFTCLANPSDLYKPGTLLRTVIGENSSLVEDLTIAYPTESKINLGSNYADIEQVISHDASAEFITEAFKKLNAKAKVDAELNYQMRVSAKNNTHYIVSDDVLSKTLSSISKGEKFIINDAKYYFIKESIGSKDVNYYASSKAGLSASASIGTDTSAAVEIVAYDNENKRVSSKEVIVCLVAEKINELAFVSGANGTRTLSYKPSAAKSDDYVIINNIIDSLGN